MSIAVVAEKPAVARDIASVLGATKKGEKVTGLRRHHEGVDVTADSASGFEYGDVVVRLQEPRTHESGAACSDYGDSHETLLRASERPWRRRRKALPVLEAQ